MTRSLHCGCAKEVDIVDICNEDVFCCDLRKWIHLSVGLSSNFKEIKRQNQWPTCFRLLHTAREMGGINSNWLDHPMSWDSMWHPQTMSWRGWEMMKILASAFWFATATIDNVKCQVMGICPKLVGFISTKMCYICNGELDLSTRFEGANMARAFGEFNPALQLGDYWRGYTTPCWGLP